jgi:hypothetical protein
MKFAHCRTFAFLRRSECAAPFVKAMARVGIAVGSRKWQVWESPDGLWLYGWPTDVQPLIARRLHDGGYEPMTDACIVLPASAVIPKTVS